VQRTTGDDRTAPVRKTLRAPLRYQVVHRAAGFYHSIAGQTDCPQKPNTTTKTEQASVRHLRSPAIGLALRTLSFLSRDSFISSYGTATPPGSMLCLQMGQVCSGKAISAVEKYELIRHIGSCKRSARQTALPDKNICVQIHIMGT